VEMVRQLQSKSQRIDRSPQTTAKKAKEYKRFVHGLVNHPSTWLPSHLVAEWEHFAVRNGFVEHMPPGGTKQQLLSSIAPSQQLSDTADEVEERQKSDRARLAEQVKLL